MAKGGALPAPYGWEVKKERFSAFELYQGTGDLRLGDRDTALLDALYQHNFLALRHLPGTWAKDGKRVLRLWEHGVVARRKVPPPVGSTSGRAWEYLYSLTDLGLACLRYNSEEDPLYDGPWTPPYQHSGGKAPLQHQLDLADLCLGIERYIGTRDVRVWWVGSGKKTILVPSKNPRQRAQILHPDAVFTSSTNHRLLVELQRDDRAERIFEHLAGYARMFARRGWDDWQRPPLVLMAIKDRPRKRGGDPFEMALAMARQQAALYGRLYLIRESMWRAGQWVVIGADPGEGDCNLFDVTTRRWVEELQKEGV